MKKITLDDIKPLPEYEKARKVFQNRIIELKKRRRIALGNRLTLVFENRETILFQIQEMMHTEHLHDEHKIREEIDTYNALIPEQGELSATLFIEITESGNIKPILDQFQGIDTEKTVCLRLGSNRIDAIFETGHSKEDKLSAVHFIRFRLNPESQRLFEDPQVEVLLIADHPQYQARTRLEMEVRRELLEDLRGSELKTKTT